MRNIQKLDWSWADNVWDAELEDSDFQACGNIIRGMESLKSFGTIFYPVVEFWHYLIEHNVTSHRLQELKVQTIFTVQECEAMIQALPRFAPALKTLRLSVLWTPDVIEEFNLGHAIDMDQDLLCTLTGLRQHPVLENLDLVTERVFQENTLRTLKEGLGGKICFTHILSDGLPFKSPFMSIS